MLGEQLGELRVEVECVEMGFWIDFGLEIGWGMNLYKLGELLAQDGW